MDLSILISRHFITLYVSGVLLLCSGTTYMLSTYAPELKCLMHYRQTEITLVETFGHVGLYFGIIPGIFYDRYGPRLVCIGGGVQLLLGYGFIAAAIRHTLWNGNMPSWATAMCFFIIGQGSKWLFIAGVMTNIKNFSTVHHGKVTGILSALVAFSSALFSVIFHAMNNDLMIFFPFMAFFMFGVSLLGSAIIQLKSIPNYDIEESYDMNSYDVPLRILDIDVTDTDIEEIDRKGCTSIIANDNKEYEEEVTTEDVNGRSFCGTLCRCSREKDNDGLLGISGIFMLTSAHFWMLMFVMAVMDGVAVMYINNVGSMVVSLRASTSRVTIVSIYSACSATGRFLWGTASDWFNPWLSRIHLLLISVSCMGIAHALVYSFPHKFILSSIFVGGSFGGLFSLGPPIIAELFGLRKFGTNWGIVTIAPAIGSIVFGYIYGQVYEHSIRNVDIEIVGKIEKKGSLNLTTTCGGQDYQSDTHCYGVDCFRKTYLISSLSCVLAAIVCITLADLILRRMKAAKKSFNPNTLEATN